MYWESVRELEPWEGVTTFLKASGFAFSLSAGVSLFPFFLLVTRSFYWLLIIMVLVLDYSWTPSSSACRFHFGS